MKAAEVRKALVALATAGGEALAYGLVPEPAVPYVMCVLAVLGCYGIWRVPNRDRPRQRRGSHVQTVRVAGADNLTPAIEQARQRLGWKDKA